MGKLVTYEPHVDARAYYKNTVYVKIEDDIQIRLPVTGIPAPTVKWCNEDGQPLAESTKINSVLEKTDDGLVAVLNIMEAQRSYAGIYMAKAVNSVGEKTLKMNVIVMDRPSEPTGRDECYMDVEDSDETIVSLFENTVDLGRFSQWLTVFVAPLNSWCWNTSNWKSDLDIIFEFDVNGVLVVCTCIDVWFISDQLAH